MNEEIRDVPSSVVVDGDRIAIVYPDGRRHRTNAAAWGASTPAEAVRVITRQAVALRERVRILDDDAEATVVGRVQALRDTSGVSVQGVAVVVDTADTWADLDADAKGTVAFARIGGRMFARVNGQVVEVAPV